MTTPGDREELVFGSYSLDPRDGVLRRDGVDILLPSRALGVLTCLLEDPGRIVPKGELIDRVWPDTAVTDHSLTEAVRALRNALGDASRSPEYIQTVHRRGYRFIAEVRRGGPVSHDRNAVANPAESRTPPVGSGWLSPSRFGLAAMLALTGVLSVALVTMRRLPPAASPDSVLTLMLAEDAPMRLYQNLFNLAISADGRSVLYAGSARGTLHVRRLDRRELEPIEGSDLARGATFSPDGLQVLYFQWDGINDADRVKPFKLLQRSLDGGGPVQLATGIARTTGLAWADDGAIAWATEATPGLWVLFPGDTEPRLIAEGSRRYYVWPQFLPDGGHVIATARSCLDPNCPKGGGEAEIVAISLASGEQRVLLDGGGRARFVAGDYLVIGRGGRLLAARFDPGAGSLISEPIVVLEGVMSARLTGLRGEHDAVYFDVSPTGNLLYASNDARFEVGDLQLVDRAGSPERLPIRLVSPQISPDGAHVVGVSAGDDGGDLFTYELGGGTAMKRLTEGHLASTPIWSATGNRVTFADRREGNDDIYLMSVTGVSGPELLYDGEHDLTPESWSPDGRILAFTEEHPETGEDIWLMSRGGQPVPFLRTRFSESAAAFSPDGEWIAYHSDESGTFEVYVRPVPEDLSNLDPSGTGYKQQLSTECGGWPVWARAGSELFYRGCRFPDSFFAVAFDGNTGGRATLPERLFGGDFARQRPGPSFSVTPGDDFLLIDVSAAVNRLEVWQNWTDELERLLPPIEQ